MGDMRGKGMGVVGVVVGKRCVLRGLYSGERCVYCGSCGRKGRGCMMNRGGGGK